MTGRQSQTVKLAFSRLSPFRRIYPATYSALDGPQGSMYLTSSASSRRSRMPVRSLAVAALAELRTCNPNMLPGKSHVLGRVLTVHRASRGTLLAPDTRVTL